MFAWLKKLFASGAQRQQHFSFRCPDCGGELSLEAVTCPHCGSHCVYQVIRANSILGRLRILEWDMWYFFGLFEPALEDVAVKELLKHDETVLRSAEGERDLSLQALEGSKTLYLYSMVIRCRRGSGRSTWSAGGRIKTSH